VLTRNSAENFFLFDPPLLAIHWELFDEKKEIEKSKDRALYCGVIKNEKSCKNSF
jgi:hypothetical protein